MKDKIPPTKEAIEQAIQNALNSQGDLIWATPAELISINNDRPREATIIAPGDGKLPFLGAEPNIPSLEAIYKGLGIPTTYISNPSQEITVVDIKSQVQAVANKKLSKEILEELDAEEPIDAEQVIASATEANKETKNAEGKKV